MVLMPFRIKVSLAILALLALSIFVLPLVLPIRPPPDTRPARTLADPDSKFIEVDGISVHYKTRGPAPTAGTPAFVLLHDFARSTYTWHAVMDGLAERGTVVAFDRPAFGLTERPAPGSWTGTNPYSLEGQVSLTVDLMSALGIDHAVLVGHSIGAVVALRTAMEHPERVHGLVLVDAAVYQRTGAPRWARWLLGTPQLNRLGPVLMRQLAGETGDEVLRNGWADPEAVPDAALDAYREAFKVDGWDVALWQYTRANPTADLTPGLGTVRAPSLVLTGALDKVVPPSDSKKLANALPDADFASIDACGHAPQEECPQAFLDAVDAWFVAQGD